MHTILITPSCSPLTTRAEAEAVQHTRCSSGAPGHTRTRTRIYIRGDARHSCAQQTAAASLIDPIIRPGNICSSSSSSRVYGTVGCYYAGCRSIHVTTPQPEHWLRPPMGKPLLINQGISLQRNHSPDVAECLLEQLRLQDVLRRRESPVEM